MPYVYSPYTSSWTTSTSTTTSSTSYYYPATNYTWSPVNKPIKKPAPMLKEEEIEESILDIIKDDD